MAYDKLTFSFQVGPPFKGKVLLDRARIGASGHETSLRVNNLRARRHNVMKFVQDKQ